MANLFGSLLAGAMTGGATANLVELRAQAEEERKLSFAKIQQQYAKENAEFVNSLGMARDDKNFSRNQAADLGKELCANERQDGLLADANVLEETRYQRNTADAAKAREQEHGYQAGLLEKARQQSLADSDPSSTSIRKKTDLEQKLAVINSNTDLNEAEKKQAVMSLLGASKSTLTQKDLMDAKAKVAEVVAKKSSNMNFPDNDSRAKWEKEETSRMMAEILPSSGQGQTEKATYVPGTILEINGKPYKVNPDGKTMSPAAPAATQKSRMSPEDQAWSDGAAKRAEDEDIRKKAANAAAMNQNISIF